MRPQNIAARMGRWSARHWKTAVIGWIVFVVASVALGSAIGTKKLTDAQSGTGGSGGADKLLDKELKRPASEQVLVASRSGAVGAPAFRARVMDLNMAVSADGEQTRAGRATGAGNQRARPTA